MWNLFKASAIRGVWVSMVGLGLGSLAGLIALALGTDVDAIAALAANVYWGLALLVVGAVGVITWSDLGGPERAIYKARRTAYGFLLGESILAAGLSSILFYTMALNIPVLFKNINVITMRAALLAQIRLESFGWVLLTALLGALVIGSWAHRRAG